MPNLFDIPRRSTQLSHDFFEQHPAIIAKELLGRVLVVERPQASPLYARLHEVAAYKEETETMSGGAFYEAGTLAISTKYGKHLIDISTSQQGRPACVTLIAANIRDGRGLREFAQGPGNLSSALGIDSSYDSIPLNSRSKTPIWIGGNAVDPRNIFSRDLSGRPENWKGTFYFR